MILEVMLEAEGIEPSDGRIGSPRWNHPAPTLPYEEWGAYGRSPLRALSCWWCSDLVELQADLNLNFGRLVGGFALGRC
jgi:hypothetical protein